MILLLMLLMTMVPDQSPSPESIYDFKIEAINGEIIDFNQYRGKKLLIVNTASKCGYTPQYDDLQKLHETYGEKITILGFPSNDFLGQEPGTNEEIASFCKLNYGVTFQMFSKISVKGKEQHDLYKWLSNKELNGVIDKAPSWNFCKYIIDEKGKVVQFFKSGVNPMDEEILDLIGS